MPLRDHITPVPSESAGARKPYGDHMRCFGHNLFYTVEGRRSITLKETFDHEKNHQKRQGSLTCHLSEIRTAASNTLMQNVR